MMTISQTGDFSIFFQNGDGQTQSRGSNCVTVPNVEAIGCGDGDFSIFQNGGRRHLGFVMRVFGPSTKDIIRSLDHCAKLVWNRSIVSIICKFQYFAS